MEVLNITGDEQAKVDPSLADAGLPPVVGVQSFQIFRASRDETSTTDGRGWTYHHHVDMACWRGRLYVGWNSCQQDEDVWPSRELFSSSTDGATWTPPAELFPQGVSTALRMYFFHASNGRMLAIAGLRLDQNDTDEDRKRGLVVREIQSDHTLGPVFTLQGASVERAIPPLYTTSTDSDFIAACISLLADRIFLEQQDRGRLLGDRRMPWHDAAAWPGGKVPGDDPKWVCGKAYSFFRRPDRTIVGVSKMGWTTTSTDSGEHWSQPVVPSTLVTGKAKVWGQQTADGRYALVYNPSRRNRFPLAIVTGNDGVHFASMRIVQGELPRQRYAGMHRSIGPQYVRGISSWADDGSRPADNGLWLTYSMNKEDIWVSRIPLPVEADTSDPVDDFFDRYTGGPWVPRWNTYRPKWASVEIARGSLQLQSNDPYDYAAATRVIPVLQEGTVELRLSITGNAAGVFEIDLVPRFGSARPVQLRFTADHTVSANTLACGHWQSEKPLALRLRIDCFKGIFTVDINSSISAEIPFAAAADHIHRIIMRTGGCRGIGGANPVPAGTDRPIPAGTLRLHRLSVHGRAK